MKRKLLPLASVLLGTILSACAVNGGYVMRYGPASAAEIRNGRCGPRPGLCLDRRILGPARRQLGLGRRPLGSPARPRAVWVPGSWSQSHRGWTFRRGYWR